MRLLSINKNVPTSMTQTTLWRHPARKIQFQSESVETPPDLSGEYRALRAQLEPIIKEAREVRTSAYANALFPVAGRSFERHRIYKMVGEAYFDFIYARTMISESNLQPGGLEEVKQACC